MRPLPCLFVALSLVRAGAANDYALTADSLAVAAGTPTGRVVRVELPQSRVYPGSGHECWLYIPDRPAPEKGYALMVFQDGGGYLNRQGAWRVPNVLDNLIHRGELPPMAAVFVNPGVTPAAHTNALPRFNRSFEYDSVDGRYAEFLEREVLPAAGRLARLSPDPDDRGIAGASSGGICAFNAAFRRPDLFRRVFCTIGTFVGLRGGDELATLVRKTEPLPVRVFLQDGSNDNNIYAGDWWMENQTLDRALEFAGYDHRCVWGDGGHDSKQGGMVFPEAMRWLWRDHPKPLAANPEAKSRAPVAGWATPGGEWTQIEAPAGDIFPAAMVAGNTFEDATASCRVPDRSLVVIARAHARHMWSGQFDDRGQLRFLQPYYHLHGDGDVSGLCADREGRIYAATENGIQIFDQPGRVNGILRLPTGRAPGRLGWAGEARDELVLETRNGDAAVTWFSRKMNVKGLRESDPAVKPEKPRL